LSGFFEWDATKLSLQVPEMDEEHKALIGLMNDLHRLHQQRSPFAGQLRALDELVRYTARHFADEEAYMERIGYAGLRIHKGVHKQLLEKLAGFRSSCQGSHELPAEIFVFFKMWLSAHICGIDMKYANHAKTAAACR
jgi:hemerythrin-like metal-binding protein